MRSEGDARRAYLQLCLDDPEVAALLAGPLGPQGSGRLADVAADGDLVVCVCDNAHEELTTADLLGPGVLGQVHWAVPDPVPADTDEAFETAYTQITERGIDIAGEFPKPWTDETVRAAARTTFSSTTRPGVDITP